MAGIAKRRDGQSRRGKYRSRGLGRERFAPHGLDVVVEPINARNVPGYFLNDFPSPAA